MLLMHRLPSFTVVLGFLAQPAILVLGILASPVQAMAIESTCYGKVNSGRLEHGVKLPNKGTNFSAYSSVGAALGRTFIHSKIRDVVVSSYQALEHAMPNKVFVYGETGWENGGRIKPHRTHQNGLSIDFMVPVVDKAGNSVSLPTSPLNKFGYGIDFDSQGKFGDLTIDFEAMAEHLYVLSQNALHKNVRITLVIFDPVLMPMLFKTTRGAYLKQTLPFMKGNAWIRHDEHYHVDFSVPCKPLN